MPLILLRSDVKLLAAVGSLEVRRLCNTFVLMRFVFSHKVGAICGQPWCCETCWVCGFLRLWLEWLLLRHLLWCLLLLLLGDWLLSYWLLWWLIIAWRWLHLRIVEPKHHLFLLLPHHLLETILVKFTGQSPCHDSSENFPIYFSWVCQPIDIDVLNTVRKALGREKYAKVKQHDS
jgi:hypothetical protein